MEIHGFLSTICILIFFSGTLLVGIFTLVFKPVENKWKSLKPLSPRFRRILLNKFPYYQNLTNLQRREFEKRLKYFLAHKKFIGINLPEVTDEMKLLIGACAVQITFGYKPIKFAHFHKIILYPKKYYSKFTRRAHCGEVNPNGIIVFSWADFMKGYSIPNDGFNVGLHEMAHALKLEDAIPEEEYAFLNNDKLAAWHRISVREMRRIKKGVNTFIRKYAAHDPEEFFAVCIEQFFETPYEFKRELPDLFTALANLLNQDPTRFYRPISEN